VVPHFGHVTSNIDNPQATSIVIDTIVEINQPQGEMVRLSRPHAAAGHSGSVAGTGLLPVIFFVTAPLQNIKLLTDRGRQVPVFRYETMALPVAGHPLAVDSEEGRREFLQAAERKFFEETRQDINQVKCLVGPHSVANCHGWIFLGGKFGIESSEIPAVLADNGYAEVEEPRQGDLAMYCKDAEITHSGLVRSVDGRGAILIESKWGPFGVYLHAPEAVPFGGRCAFYRSPRGGHAVEIKEVGG
jgi:hypothetical protein